MTNDHYNGRTPAPASQVHSESDRVVLDELAKVLDAQQPAPKVGLDASASMKSCYETVAVDIERLAQEAVDRALAIQQEAQTFAAVIREAGAELCARIETETTRGYQISSIMRTAQKMASTPPK